LAVPVEFHGAPVREILDGNDSGYGAVVLPTTDPDAIVPARADAAIAVAIHKVDDRGGRETREWSIQPDEVRSRLVPSPDQHRAIVDGLPVLEACPEENFLGAIRADFANGCGGLRPKTAG